MGGAPDPPDPPLEPLPGVFLAAAFAAASAFALATAALSSLVRSGELKSEIYDKAINDLGISKVREDITSL